MQPTLALRTVAKALKTPTTQLFEGRRNRSGNNVPHSKHKTKRKWHPNVQTRRIYSEALGGTVKVRLAVSALRNIDKCGGLDAYMLSPKIERAQGESGMKLRMKIREAEKANVEAALAQAMKGMSLSKAESATAMATA